MRIRVTDAGSCNANQNVRRSQLGNWNVRLLKRFSELHESHRSHFLAIATRVLNECLSRTLVPNYFFVVTRVTVKISLGRTCPSGRPGPSCEMMRDLKIFSVSSTTSSTAVESEDSPLNRQVVINRPCSIRHCPRELSPSSGGSIIQVPSARY